MDSAGLSASGLFRKPYPAAKLQCAVGLIVKRPEYESSLIVSKFQRLSSGSRPLKNDPSTCHCLEKIPAVMTPKLTWVASCQ